MLCAVPKHILSNQIIKSLGLLNEAKMMDRLYLVFDSQLFGGILLNTTSSRLIDAVGLCLIMIVFFGGVIAVCRWGVRPPARRQYARRPPRRQPAVGGAQ